MVVCHRSRATESIEQENRGLSPIISYCPSPSAVRNFQT
jgi:hypothetical protein